VALLNIAVEPHTALCVKPYFNGAKAANSRLSTSFEMSFQPLLNSHFNEKLIRKAKAAKSPSPPRPATKHHALINPTLRHHSRFCGEAHHVAMIALVGR
jgi:hypothetical protein